MCTVCKTACTCVCVCVRMHEHVHVHARVCVCVCMYLHCRIDSHREREAFLVGIYKPKKGGCREAPLTHEREGRMEANSRTIKVQLIDTNTYTNTGPGVAHVCDVMLPTCTCIECIRVCGVHMG